MSLKKPPKILNLREFQMAKRMLLGRKEAPCQKELAAVLNAMDRREGTDASGLRILRAALEHCMHEAEAERRRNKGNQTLGYLARATKKG